MLYGGKQKPGFTCKNDFIVAEKRLTACAIRLQQSVSNTSAPDIVDIQMGDSPQRLVGKVYTHFPDDFKKKQMDLVIFPTPTKK